MKKGFCMTWFSTKLVLILVSSSILVDLSTHCMESLVEQPLALTSSNESTNQYFSSFPLDLRKKCVLLALSLEYDFRYSKVIPLNSFVLSIALSPTKKTVLTGSNDNKVRLLDISTGILIKTFEKHKAPIRAVAFSHTGETALTGSDDKKVRLWDLNTGKSLKKFKGHTSGIYSVALNPTETIIFTGSDEGKAFLWNKKGKILKKLKGHTDRICSAVFSFDGEIILTGSNDYTARLWNVKTGESLQVLKGHTSSIYAVALSPDGAIALTGSNDKTARLWGVKTGNSIRTFEGFTHAITSVAFSPDGKTILIGCRNGKIFLHNFLAQEQPIEIQAHTKTILSLALSADKKTVITGSLDQTIGIGSIFHWDDEFEKLFKKYYPLLMSIDTQAVGSSNTTSSLALSSLPNSIETSSNAANNCMTLYKKIFSEGIPLLEMSYHEDLQNISNLALKTTNSTTSSTDQSTSLLSEEMVKNELQSIYTSMSIDSPLANGTHKNTSLLSENTPRYGPESHSAHTEKNGISAFSV